MPQSFCHVWIHLIFSTKHRLPFLDADLSQRHFPYMAGIFIKLDAAALLINGVADHVHCLFQLHATKSVAEVVRDVKSNSAGWVHDIWPQRRNFAWQSGYAAFGVSQSNVDEVRDYIARQHEHHQRVSFQDEVRLFLARHGIEYDERYVWD